MLSYKIKRKSLRIYTVKKIMNAIAAGITIAIVVLVFQALKFESVYGTGSGAIIYASVGASAFILFIMPKSRAASKTALIVSYVLAGVVGYLSYTLSIYMGDVIASAVAVASISSLMVILRQEHPPAAGLALAFVLYGIGPYGIGLVVSLGVLIVMISYTLEALISGVEKEI